MEIVYVDFFGLKVWRDALVSVAVLAAVLIGFAIAAWRADL